MHGEGPLLVLAGPGSGKTYTMTKRILRMIEDGISPDSILVITFTKAAALAMQSRFQAMAGTSSSVNFGTFHSVFYTMLRISGFSKNSSLLTEAEKREILFSILRQYTMNHKKQTQELKELAMLILTAIGYYKNTGEWEESARKLPPEVRELFKEVYTAYEERKKRRNAIDFDDMLVACEEMLLSDPRTLTYWQRRFSYILVDEFQDINARQYHILKLLAGEKRNVFVVGDDDQAIYGFRGSRPACMKQFAEEFAAREITLDINYRSLPAIIQASDAVIAQNKDRFGKRMRPSEEHGQRMEQCVFIDSYPEREEEWMKITEALASRGTEEHAVLFRTNLYLQSFAGSLKRAGIPYLIRERAGCLYDHFVVQDLMAYLTFASGCGTREQLLRIINRPSRFVGREALYSGRGDQITLNEVIAYYEQGYASLPSAKVVEILQRLRMLQRQLAFVKQLTLPKAIDYICRVCGYERYLKEAAKHRSQDAEGLEEWLHILDILRKEAGEYAYLREWLDAQEACRMEKEGSNALTQCGTGENPVQLMTVHASKGLEFDVVWIPDCNEKIYPHGVMPSEDVVEEERRIFYVAMTRAKKVLRLSYITGSQERPRAMSRFLKPLLPRRR